MIRQWEANRCIPRATKIIALAAMVLVGGSSIWLALESVAARVAALALVATGCVTVLLIPTCRSEGRKTGPS